MLSCSYTKNHSISTIYNLKECAVPETWLTAFVRLEDINEVAKKQTLEDKNVKSKNDQPKEANVGENETIQISQSFSPLEKTAKPESIIRKTSKEKEVAVTWDPNAEYEIEKILHHKKWGKNRMLYLVKWKGWGDEYNTYEPIENLTHCNYMLMKYLERTEPTTSQLRNMDYLVEKGLFRHKLFNKFEKFRYQRKDLVEFSTNCLNIDPIFESGDNLLVFEKAMREEYGDILRCLVALSMLRQKDEMLFLKGINYKIVLYLINLRWEQLKNLCLSQAAINTLEETEIEIVNVVDLEPFPKFEYVFEMQHGKDVVVPTDPPLGCECLGHCNPNSKCCPALADSHFAYSASRILNIPEGFPIYECNQKCICSDNCANRVVQNGRKIKLCIFKTELCGWGVRAVEPIRKGTFVAEYVGELINEEEANARDLKYLTNKMTSYLFALDFNPDHGPDMYTIDATRCGNVARFINHSCNPNLAVYPVWIDCLDPNLPRLAFFARRNIKKNEEITFDYENVREDLDLSAKNEEDQRRLKCKCKAADCRGWIFGN